MTSYTEKGRPSPGEPRYEPKVIIHGGAGDIRREDLPPDLYDLYDHSLRSYLESTQKLLENGSSALDAVCHAVSLLEDNPLFNCGRGSVFTTAGKIEMEASVMVASLDPTMSLAGGIKRTGAVSRVRNTRHPIQLARAVLLDADREQGRGGTDTMHCHISGRGVEEWGWTERSLQWKDDDWFWTKKRWDEHRRDLEGERRESPLPSQGTVGAVCFDAQGSIAVATSTGGLTNKAPGRVGDTPSVGAGFWAESWEETSASRPSLPAMAMVTNYLATIGDCIPQLSLLSGLEKPHHETCQSTTRRAVAMSGTGNGDAFLRLAAAHTAGAQCRFTSTPLKHAVTAMAGPNGALQNSAGDRWMETGEGRGGIIGIEAAHGVCACGHHTLSAKVVWDFNCGGMWRAMYIRDPKTGAIVPSVMVFREPY